MRTLTGQPLANIVGKGEYVSNQLSKFFQLGRVKNTKKNFVQEQFERICR